VGRYDCSDSHADSLLRDYTVIASFKHFAGDKFDAITCWQSTKHILAYTDKSRFFWTTDGISYSTHYKVVDGDFVDGDRGYLAVRKKDAQGEYLYGWIELEVLDDFMNVFAHSYAMELSE
jgi:hypothetical protein